MIDDTFRGTCLVLLLPTKLTLPGKQESYKLSILTYEGFLFMNKQGLMKAKHFFRFVHNFLINYFVQRCTS